MILSLEMIFCAWSTAAVKLILGCLGTTSHENILNYLGLTPLHIFRQFNICIAFWTMASYPLPLLANFSKLFQLFIAFSSLFSATLRKISFSS